MLGKNVVYDEISFFWTRLFDKSLHYTGIGVGSDSNHVEGDVESLDFLKYYFKNNKVIAACGMGRAPAL